MTHIVALVLIIAGVGYLALTVALSRRKRRVLTGLGDEPSTVIFVVPALNEELVIESTVRRLLDCCGSRGRVLVVNDGSTDETATVLAGIRSDRLTVHTRTAPDAQRGKGVALNDAYRRIRAEVHAAGVDPTSVVLCIVDADGRLQHDVLDHVGPYFADPTVGATQLLVRIRNRRSWLCRFQDYEFLVFSSLTQTAREHLGSVGLGGNGQFTRLAALMDLGDDPWSECLTEDLDLGVRLAIAGWTNRFCGETHVDQQGLNSLRLLLKQRTRWAHGHLQCWKLIPDLIRSQLPTVTVLDLSYYLLAPAFVLASSLIFSASTIALAVAVVLAPSSFATTETIVLASLVYLLSFGPSLVLAGVYRRRSGDISRRATFAMAHMLALYNYVWYVAEWRALVRIILRRRGWSKTRRSSEPDTDITIAAPARGRPPVTAWPPPRSADLYRTAMEGY